MKTNVIPLRRADMSDLTQALEKIRAEIVPEHGFNGAIILMQNSHTGVWGCSWVGELRGVNALGLLEIGKNHILKNGFDELP